MSSEGLGFNTSVIPAVILAAGLSTRMGRPKALLPVNDEETFLSRLVRSFIEASVDDVVVVLGYEREAIEASIRSLSGRVRVVVNERFEEGQFSSVLTALDAVDRPGVRAMLMTLVDVPLVAPETIRAVVKRYRASGAPIVRPVRGEEHGHPVLIDRALFAELRGADPAHGAKPVVRSHVSADGDVSIDDAGAFIDIDTPETYFRVFGRNLTNE